MVGATCAPDNLAWCRPRPVLRSTLAFEALVTGVSTAMLLALEKLWHGEAHTHGRGAGPLCEF